MNSFFNGLLCCIALTSSDVGSGWDSGLWRGEFVHGESDPPAGAERTGKNQTSGHAGADVLHDDGAGVTTWLNATHIPGAVEPVIEPLDAFSEDVLAEMGQPHAAEADPDSARLSAWDAAALNVRSGPLGPRTTAAGGPSLISVVVAMTGLVVVAGAYLSGK
jgi:hypothetical protein